MRTVAGYIRSRVAEFGREEYYHSHKVPRKVTDNLDRIHRKFLGEYDGYRFYLVDGLFIRNEINDDFYSGNFARDLYIPEPEIWIEDYSDPRDQVPTMVHEYLEADKMVSQNWDYERAHEFAARQEMKIRKSHLPIKNIFENFLSLVQN